MSCIEEIILNLEKRFIKIDSERILYNVMEKFSDRYRKSMEFKPNVDFLILVFKKIGDFLQNSYSVAISTFTFNHFSDNFFIMKTKDNLELFEDNKEVQVAYFPINKDKILYFINIDKNQDKSFINTFFESIDQDNVMINKRNIFTVTIEK